MGSQKRAIHQKKKISRGKSAARVTGATHSPTKGSELAQLVGFGESEMVEFKSSFNDEAIETVGAFANTSGGKVLIGVNDSGAVGGFQIGKKTLEDLASRIQEATDPRLQPSIRRESLEGKDVVVITVSPASRGPVSIRGRYFRRVGRTNQRMSHDEIMRRVSYTAGYSWDSMTVTGKTVSDLDMTKVRAFMSKVIEVRRSPLTSIGRGDKEYIRALEKFDYIVNGKPTHAAIVLFGKKPESVSITGFLKIGRFRSPTHIVDDKEVHGTLFEQIDEAMAWFRQRLETELVITGKPERDEKWEYPLDAVREAVINAVCHRDYGFPAHSQIRLYDDYLNIWNPGPLVAELSLADLLKHHRSVPRNPLIAKALFYTELIEHWGSGTIRMAKELKSAGMPAPVFETATQGGFAVTFKRWPFTAEELDELAISGRLRAALEYAMKNGRITNQIYQAEFKVSKRTSSDELAVLVRKGVFERRGKTGKGTYYVPKGQ